MSKCSSYDLRGRVDGVRDASSTGRTPGYTLGYTGWWGVVLVVSPRRLARGRGRRLREPRALGRRPGHREARLHADDVVALDERAAVVVRDRLRARARRLVRHV